MSPPAPGRPATVDIADLLTRLREAGSVEAEVIRILKDRLVLRSELGEILTRNRLDLRRGDRIRIRLAGSDSSPVLKVRPAPQPPATIAADQIPRLARELPADRPVLAEIMRTLPRATEIRLAGQIHRLPLGIESAGDRLVSLERRPATGSIELRPLERAPIYRALLRHLLPRQASGDADSLLRLFELARPRSPSPASPAETPGRSREPVARGPAVAAPVAARLPPPSTTGTIAQRPSQPPAIDSRQPPATPPIAAAMRVQTAPVAQTPHPVPVPASAVIKSGDGRSAVSTSTPPSSRPAAPGAPATTQPPPKLAHDHPSTRAPSTAGPSAARTPAADPAGAATRAATATPASPAPDLVAATNPPAIAAPLARLLEWLPRSAELDAPRLRHWIELLGFARPAAAAGARPPDLVDWLRQLQAFDAPARETAAPAPRRGAAPGGADAQAAAGDDREAAPGLPRESLRLAEQALSHNLLQRVAAGLQQETQQPLNLSLTLPFVDGSELRPLRLELEQRGRSGETGGEPVWDLRVSFEFGALGPVTCHLVLAGRALAASFYCRHDATSERLAAALPELRRQLDAAGFEPGELHSFVGQPRAPQTTATIGAEFLIDLEA